jgi:hypothetical protein
VCKSSSWFTTQGTSDVLPDEKPPLIDTTPSVVKHFLSASYCESFIVKPAILSESLLS